MYLPSVTAATIAVLLAGLLFTSLVTSAAVPGSDTGLEIDTLLDKAAALRRAGHLDSSTLALTRAQALAEQHDDAPRLALALAGLSDSHLLSRELGEAVALARRSVTVAGRSESVLASAVALNHLGNAHAGAQDFSAAEVAYREGLVAAAATGDQALHGALLLNLAQALFESRSFAKVDTTLHRADAVIAARRDGQGKRFDLIFLGALLMELAAQRPAHEARFAERAHAALASALQLARAANDNLSSAYASSELSQLYLSRSRLAEAERLARRGLRLLQSADSPQLTGELNWRLGRALQAQGRLAAAASAYDEGVRHVSSIQPALVYGHRGRTFMFRDRVAPLYRDYVSVLLRQATEAPAGSARSQRYAAVRELMEGLKVVELKNYFKDDCVDDWRLDNERTALGEKLGSGTATLYPVLLQDRAVLLLGLPGGAIEAFDVAVGLENLRHTALRFREQLMRPGNPRRVRHFGKTLYDWLIAPLEPALSRHDIHTLVVVPDDTLRSIPLAALFDGEHFLVERLALGTTAALSLTKARPAATAAQPMLLLGLSTEVPGFSPLPHVPRELKQLSASGASTTLLDASFSESRVRSALAEAPYSAVVFATHGRVHSNPRKSFLLTHDGKITFDELETYLQSNRQSRESIDLLVLSACETAVGDERAALGFAGMAVKAGAGSVLASLWLVNDESTATLVPAFVEALKTQGRSKAEALRRVQLEMLRRDVNAHPFYWAPFVLIGNWR